MEIDVSGITPAYAGKSSGVRCRTSAAQDHPRLCGEKGKVSFVGKTQGGSPPPMRGKAQKQACESFNDRITPAYSGKSYGYYTIEEVSSGSPPPMRGKACFFQLGDVPAGITPAYAGKRTVSPFSFTCFWDHPRLCGEKAHGSICHLRHNRITPAYAGKRSCLCMRGLPP